ncbi:MAG: hypothetical protein AAF732_24045 [Pseudomonadota bacterium]
MKRSESEAVVLVAETRRDRQSGVTRRQKTSQRTSNGKPVPTRAFRTKAIMWVAVSLIAPMFLGVVAAIVLSEL